MKKINLGTLRSIEVFEPVTDDREVLKWNGFLEKIVFKNTSWNNYELFGSVNEMHPLLRQISSDKIFVFEAIEQVLVLIARSTNEFDSIVGGVMEIWKDHDKSYMIVRTKDVMEQFNLFVQELKQMNGVDVAWWVNFAFKELNVHFLF